MNKEDLDNMFIIAEQIGKASGRRLDEITVKETVDEYEHQCEEYFNDMVADAAIEEEKAFPSDWCDGDIY